MRLKTTCLLWRAIRYGHGIPESVPGGVMQFINAAICKILMARFGAVFVNEIAEPAEVFWPQVNLPQLRSEQEQALVAWTEAGYRGQVHYADGDR